MDVVHYDYKFFVADTPENRKKLKEKGITQICFETDTHDWYVGISDLLEDSDVSEEDIEKMRDERWMFQVLIDKVFPDGYIEIYGTKKSIDDETRKVWGTDDFWEALEKMREWIGKNFAPYLEFGNDDLNGWTLVSWKVPAEKEIVELCRECSEIVS